MGPLFIEALRYHRWANLHVLDACAKLADDHLELTTPGTFGTIRATLLHLCGAEQGYVQRLGGSARRLTRESAFPGVEALKGEAGRSADELIAIAQRVEPGDEFEADFQDGRYRLKKGVVLLQALHHGNDHRTHVCTIFGAHGLDYGDMDVWAYGDVTGDIRPVEAR